MQEQLKIINKLKSVVESKQNTGIRSKKQHLEINKMLKISSMYALCRKEVKVLLYRTALKLQSEIFYLEGYYRASDGSIMGEAKSTDFNDAAKLPQQLVICNKEEGYVDA